MNLQWGIWQGEGILVLGDQTGKVRYSVALTDTEGNATLLLSFLHWLILYAKTLEEWKNVRVEFIDWIAQDLPNSWEVSFDYNYRVQ